MTVEATAPVESIEASRESYRSDVERSLGTGWQFAGLVRDRAARPSQLTHLSGADADGRPPHPGPGEADRVGSSERLGERR